MHVHMYVSALNIKAGLNASFSISTSSNAKVKVAHLGWLEEPAEELIKAWIN